MTTDAKNEIRDRINAVTGEKFKEIYPHAFLGERAECKMDALIHNSSSWHSYLQMFVLFGKIAVAEFSGN